MTELTSLNGVFLAVIAAIIAILACVWAWDYIAFAAGFVLTFPLIVRLAWRITLWRLTVDAAIDLPMFRQDWEEALDKTFRFVPDFDWRAYEHSLGQSRPDAD